VKLFQGQSTTNVRAVIRSQLEIAEPQGQELSLFPVNTLLYISYMKFTDKALQQNRFQEEMALL
jgi:hypothetical protein